MGLLVGGVCFILPAAILVACIAWAYVRFGHLPAVAGLLYGVKPVVVAVILQALWGLGRTAVKNSLLAIAGMICIALSFFGVNALLILAGTGTTIALIHVFYLKRKKVRSVTQGAFALLRRSVAAKGTSLLPLLGASTAATVAPAMWSLFLDGVNVASLALMAAVSYQLGRAAIIDLLTIGLTIVSAVLLLRFRINSAWLVLGGALVGIVAQAVRGY